MEQILSNIRSDYEIVSATRLNRPQREGDIITDNTDGWVPSESIRLGFKSSSLPKYVKLFDMNISVNKYTFPVTQCSKCWKFGHIALKCGSNKITCPNCAQHHTECNTNEFVCANCSLNHRAVDKICPVYKKEKTLRELMSDFNCTYQKALMLFVPMSPAPLPRVERNIDYPPINNVATTSTDTAHNIYKTTFSEKVKQTASTSNINDSRKLKTKNKKIHKEYNEKNEGEIVMECESDDDSTSVPADCNEPIFEGNSNGEPKHRKGNITLLNVLRRISGVILREKSSPMEKLVSVGKIIWEWLMPVAIKYLADNSFVINLFNGLQS